jgi:hypothetical protein
MSGFSAEWLRLREPFDHAARQQAGLHAIVASWADDWRAPPHDGVLQIVDLACGCGANLRELALHLGGRQRWRLIDHDPALLAAVRPAMQDWAGQHALTLHHTEQGLCLQGSDLHIEVVTEQRDLAAHLATLDLRGTHLLTASALLDLVSARWLHELAHLLQTSAVASLFVLSVDGRTHWSDQHAHDALVDQLFTQHQGRDKGFGPALGPQAARAWTHILQAAAFDVHTARSDWHIDGAQDARMLGAMIEGQAQAATEQEPGAASHIQTWRVYRAQHLAHTRLTIGHVDILARPASPIGLPQD